jgi:steroid 5-alpha reductase family enzyme
MQWNVFAGTALAVLLLMLSVWAYSVKIKDASIVDIIWGLGFVMIAWVSKAIAKGNFTRQWVLVVLTTIWGLRLAGYLYKRNHGNGEDFRYRAMRKHYGPKFPIISLVSVFGLQGVLMWVVSMPLQLGMMRPTTAGIGLLGIIGIALWIVGFGFETVGDAQLAKFKADPASKGQVMNKGLWGWTRHPNYFGDFCMWWGLFLIAAVGGGFVLLSVIGPLVMSGLLMRVSGVPMLEKTIGRRRPGYAEYVASTSGFFPRPPKR